VRGGVSRPGRALLISLGFGSLLFVPIVFGVSLAVFYLLIFIWGLGAGVAMSMARTIVQESAPASHRARIMSVYSLGMMGGMPFGSLLMGYVIGAFGPHLAALVPVLGMAVAVAWIAAKSDLWTLVPHPEVVRV
jgi:MFS family permease